MKKLYTIIIIWAMLLATSCNVTAIYPTKTVTIEKVETVLPRYFQSVEELRGWLGALEQPDDPDLTCVALAFDLQFQALADGYYMNFYCSKNYFYNWFFIKQLEEEGTPAYNSTRIGDRIYFIDPGSLEISRFAAFLVFSKEEYNAIVGR